MLLSNIITPRIVTTAAQIPTVVSSIQTKSLQPLVRLWSGFSELKNLSVKKACLKLDFKQYKENLHYTNRSVVLWTLLEFRYNSAAAHAPRPPMAADLPGALWDCSSQTVAVRVSSPACNDKQPLISAAGTIYLLFLSLLQLIVYAAPACITCFLATVGIRSSTPPTPPSASAVSSSSEPFLQGMKQVRRLGKITENLAAPRKPNIAR